MFWNRLRMILGITISLVILLLSACGGRAPAAAPTPPGPPAETTAPTRTPAPTLTPIPASTPTPSPTPTPAPSPTPSPTPTPEPTPTPRPVCFFAPPVISSHGFIEQRDLGLKSDLQGVTFDGQYYWMTVETTTYPPGKIPDGKMLKMDPVSFKVLEVFNHPSTSPTGITYNPDENVFITNAPLGGPREEPWATGQDFFFVHDPQTLEVIATYPAPTGINSVFYNPSTRTYFSVAVVFGTLHEHRGDDFSIINSYRLPAPHYPKGLTMIPNPDGAPYILVTYYTHPSLPQDGSGDMLQILQIVDNELRLLRTIYANDGYTFGVMDLVWVEQEQKLVTVGMSWIGVPGFGIYIHDNNAGCYPLPGIPP